MDELKEFILRYAIFPWAVFLAILGGTANYVSRVRRNVIPWSSGEWIGEMFVSGVTGTFTALLFMGSGAENLFFVALCAGISGHMGGKALFIMDGILSSILTKVRIKLNL